MFKNKLIFCTLGLIAPLGLNVLYLKGLKNPWGWLQFSCFWMGLLGYQLLGASDMGSAVGWVLASAGFLSLEASWLTTIVYGLRPDEKWDAQFNAHTTQTNQSGWLVIICVILSLMIGAGVMMASLAIAFEQHFLSQYEEARKISQ